VSARHFLPALFGATGAIAESVAGALRAAGRRYRAVGRSRKALEARYGEDPLAEIVAWNPDNPSSVRAACRGVESIVYLVEDFLCGGAAAYPSGRTERAHPCALEL